MIFTKKALTNIEKYGNVWGISPEYRFYFTINLPRKYKAKFSWKRADSFMGRFGGGWNWKLGIQIGGSTVILNLCTFMIRIGK